MEPKIQHVNLYHNYLFSRLHASSQCVVCRYASNCLKVKLHTYSVSSDIITRRMDVETLFNVFFLSLSRL